MSAGSAPILTGPVALAGCGNMGGAMAQGWLKAGLSPQDLWIVEPSAETRDAWGAKGCRCVAEGGLLTEPAATLVVAVKPQMMSAVLPTLRQAVGPDTLVVSIAAGTPIEAFESAFGSETAVVRTMPNTPAAVGRGISALVANANADDAAKEQAEALMAAVGKTVWLDDEADLHAVTALSGGGPAYVFLLIEALSDAGVELGLVPEVSQRLARATVEGSGELAFQDPKSAETLRRNVTSPGGTTAEALAVLMHETEGLRPLLAKAIAAAAARSRELASD